MDLSSIYHKYPPRLNPNAETHAPKTLNLRFLIPRPSNAKLEHAYKVHEAVEELLPVSGAESEDSAHDAAIDVALEPLSWHWSHWPGI